MATLLRERNFLLLWLGQLCSQCGDRLTQLVLIALVAARAPGSSLTLAKILVATSLPALILNPFAGVYVDRWDRKRTMITCDIVRAAAILALPALARSGSGIPLYLGVFLIFSVGAFFFPARLALIPDLVPSHRLAQANALFNTSGMIGSTVILLGGALLVEWAGPMRSCWVNAASYVGSACFIAPILWRRRRHRASHASAATILREIGEGIRELWRHRATRRAAGLMGILMGGAGASFIVGTVLIQQSMGSVTKDLGFLSLWLGVGMLIGTLAYGRWGTKVERQLILGIAFLGCGSALWAFVGAVLGLRSSVAASAAASLLGFWIAPVGIVTNTLVHEGHPERLHGRIFSSFGVVVNVSLISSMLVAGWMVEQGGRGMLLMAVGAAFAVSGFALLWYTKRR